jgi:predicted enzyme related to lactoylglutathione lyase
MKASPASPTRRIGIDLLMPLIALLSAPLISPAAPLTGPTLNITAGSSQVPNHVPNTPNYVQSLTVTAVPSVPNFTANWTSPSPAPWLGTIVGTGYSLLEKFGAYTTDVDFSGLTNGELPVDTFIYFGDLDNGSHSGESYTITAYDSANSVITSPWLDDMVFCNAGTLPTSLASCVWNGSDYFLDGSAVPGNPHVGFFLRNNQAIRQLHVVSTGSNHIITFYAPLENRKPDDDDTKDDDGDTKDDDGDTKDDDGDTKDNDGDTKDDDGGRDTRNGEVVWSELQSGDRSASAKFYRKVLGWKLQGHVEGHVLYGTETEIRGSFSTAETQPHWIPFIKVANVDETVRRAEENGAKLILKPSEMPNKNGRVAIIIDPAGVETGLAELRQE